MSKKYYYIIPTLLIVMIALGVISRNLQDHNHETVSLESLPEIQLISMDSTQVLLHDLVANKVAVLVFFNSECKICHEQVDEFYKRSYKLNEVKVMMISEQDLSDIRSFKMNYPNAAFPFFKAEYESLHSSFGGWNAPQVRIYDTSRKLIKKVDGICRVAHVKRYLEKE